MKSIKAHKKPSGIRLAAGSRDPGISPPMLSRYRGEIKVRSTGKADCGARLFSRSRAGRGGGANVPKMKLSRAQAIRFGERAKRTLRQDFAVAEAAPKHPISCRVEGYGQRVFVSN
jgi:hypothetical protein